MSDMPPYEACNLCLDSLGNRYIKEKDLERYTFAPYHERNSGRILN